MTQRWIGLVAVALLVLVGCSSTDEEIPYVERPPQDIYTEAMAELEEDNYETAAQLFDEVERQHPYSEWATRAQLMAAFAYYEDLKYDDAILALDRFIQLHPGHERIDYAYYLRAISYYEQISDVQRDQKATQRARTSLEDVVRRFPNSEYARDATLKLDLTEDHLAGKEMTVGRYYLKRGNYNAAINRFRRVIEAYQTTSHVPEALHRLVECYLALGITPEAQAAAAVLGHNYPGSDWYLDSYAVLVDESVRPEGSEPSWINQAFDTVF